MRLFTTKKGLGFTESKISRGFLCKAQVARQSQRLQALVLEKGEWDPRLPMLDDVDSYVIDVRAAICICNVHVATVAGARTKHLIICQLIET